MSELPERRASELARLERLVEHTNELVIVASVDGRVLDHNPACTPLLGYAREELLAMNLIDLVDPEDLPRAFEHFARELETPGPVAPFDLRARRKDGRWRWFETRLEVVGEDTHLINGHDITERRRDRRVLDGQARALALVARRAPIAEVVAAIGESLDAITEDARAAVICKCATTPLVWAPDLPARWGREVMVRMMGAETAVEGVDVLLDALAVDHDLTPAWSTPIRDVAGNDLGRILLYPDPQRRPTVEQQAALDAMADLVSIAAGLHRSDAPAPSAVRDER